MKLGLGQAREVSGASELRLFGFALKADVSQGGSLPAGLVRRNCERAPRYKGPGPWLSNARGGQNRFGIIPFWMGFRRTHFCLVGIGMLTGFDPPNELPRSAAGKAQGNRRPCKTLSRISPACVTCQLFVTCSCLPPLVQAPAKHKF